MGLGDWLRRLVFKDDEYRPLDPPSSPDLEHASDDPCGQVPSYPYTDKLVEDHGEETPVGSIWRLRDDDPYSAPIFCRVEEIEGEWVLTSSWQAERRKWIPSAIGGKKISLMVRTWERLL